MAKIKDEHEKHAQEIAKAIFDEDTLKYVASKQDAKMETMTRSDLIYFRERSS